MLCLLPVSAYQYLAKNTVPSIAPSSYPPRGQYPSPYPMPPASTAAYPTGSNPAQFPTPYPAQQYQPTSTFTPAVATAASTAAVSTVASNAEKGIACIHTTVVLKQIATFTI